ncbi:DUF3488 domain-containing protein [Oculatella sp. LEGE 06141]|uniref:transglutaminase TgpA family protein n=1 Tax=Oculatella sp. LEGE 06141 TaxID=1828648 RepID=UPI00187F6522|nr:DUF3488 and DUF4129 domain-containing transglutaminase family protein [Oculatella sp. LEGE 06141]MBE9182666.1 DUF3488 domain-containing protein [Oculatella sp. LEGE 06141]
MSNRSIEPHRSFASVFKKLRQQFETIPSPQPEDSLLLRVLVQALVSVGIIATDIAAADIADPLGISVWAVPVSAVGASWSWFRRYSRNIPVKFCIAIAMLVALAIFLMSLINQENDTRLVLAALLIQLQVFHSFDLPRRKDLGYSIVIGLILLGVAATISQTLAFAPMLLLFLAIGLPALVLDYRSRLGLLSQRVQEVSAGLSLKRLGVVLLITVGLGLTIFAVLPRFPGYQLRTFPVSSPIEFEGQFDGSTIINSGYVREGKTGTGSSSGSGGNVERGPGQLDANVYYGFNDRINQNLRGEMQPKVVMRIRSQAPGFWRVMAFDRYNGQGWEVSRNDEAQIQKLNRPSWSYRFNLPLLLTFNRTREVVQSYTVTADLPNLIPALYEPKELYFPTREVARDLEGGLRSPIPLSEGLTYTVVSQVPYRDRTRLRQSTQTYPPNIRDYYLQIPDALTDRLRQTTNDILAAAPTQPTAPSEQALYLAQYLKQNYTVQSDLGFLEEDEDLVDTFLFKAKGGYPDHFATTLTMMLRSIGIPARLVVGFGSGEFNPFTGFYVVRNTDAYAMTEVYFNRYGWLSFDAIPGHEVEPVSVEDSRVFSVLRQFWHWIAGWLPSPVTGVLSFLLERLAAGLGGAIAFLVSLFSNGWRGILAALGLITSLGFLGWLGWNSWQSWRYRWWLARLPAMEALYQHMLHWLADQGFHKAPFQTPLEYAQQLESHYDAAHAEIIEEIAQAYVRWRYGQHVANLDGLRQRFQTLQRTSKRSSDRHSQRVGKR